jgi:serine/threonine protein kinase/CheY-like chemotaxis protein
MQNDENIPKKIDRYDLAERIGAGGMGLIYKGFDTKLKRTVAIKIISDRVKDSSVKATIRERFFNEARAAGALSHPNLVQIYDFNEVDGLAYIVMEFIEGETVDELIKSKGPLNDDDLLRVGKEVASGLAFAHRKGIVHRDIKPSNIIIEAQSGVAKILDFGIAKFVNEDEMKLTSTGMVLGSTHYLSPEHIVGKNLDHRSDIFCLGTLLYEAATGTLPFRGQNSSTILYKIVHFDPPHPTELRSGMQPALANAIMRCLKKDPRERFQKCEDLEKELSNLQFQTRSEKISSGTGSIPSLATKSLYVRDSQLLAALQAAKKITSAQSAALKGKKVVDTLLRDEVISEDDLTKVISECLQISWIPRGRLRALRVQTQAFETLPLEILEKYRILPFFLDGSRKALSLVIDGAHDFQKEEAFANLAGEYQLQFYVGGSVGIQRLIDAKAEELQGTKRSRRSFGDTGDHTLSESFDIRRVLIVDPTEQSHEGLIRLFKGREQNLVLVGNAEEALSKSKRESFDFVWAHRTAIGDELYFETQLLKMNPNCDIRYFEDLGHELFQETINYRRFREFFNRIAQMYLSPMAKEGRTQALSFASLAVRVAQALTTTTRQLDEVYFSCLFWKADKIMNTNGKAFDLFDGVYHFRHIGDCITERFDGRGPLGLREDQVPLASRVIASLLLFEGTKPNGDQAWTEAEVNELRGKYSQYATKQLDPRLTGAILELIRPRSSAANQKKTKVVIVDSDEKFSQRLAAQLKELSSEATVYHDGLSALQGIKKDKPDLVISEVLVSKLDGFALCARLRSDDLLKSVPVIFLSDSQAPEHSTKALQLGAEDFLSKTQDSQFIMAKLERVLKRTA